MTPEGRVKVKVKKLLAQYGAYYHMPVQNGMGAPSLDFVGCYLGRFYAVETKAPGKQLTARQLITAEAMSNAGGWVFAVSTDEDIVLFEKWLAHVSTLPALAG